MVTSGSPNDTALPFPLPLLQNSLSPQHQSILQHVVRTSSAFLPLPSRNPKLLIHRRTRAHSLAAASTSPDLLLWPHLPLPPPLETSSLLIHHYTIAHSVPTLTMAPDLLRRYSRQPQRICSSTIILPTGDASSTPPGAAPPTPPSTTFDPLRRHLPQPYQSRFANTIVNPTGVASPIPFSTLPGPLCQLTSPRPRIRYVAPSSNPPEQLFTPRPQPQICIVDTILNPTPTTEAPSPTPSSTTTNPLCPHRCQPYRSCSTNTLLDGSRSPYRTSTASVASSP